MAINNNRNLDIPAMEFKHSIFGKLAEYFNREVILRHHGVSNSETLAEDLGLDRSLTEQLIATAAVRQEFPAKLILEKWASDEEAATMFVLRDVIFRHQRPQCISLIDQAVEGKMRMILYIKIDDGIGVSMETLHTQIMSTLHESISGYVSTKGGIENYQVLNSGADWNSPAGQFKGKTVTIKRRNIMDSTVSTTVHQPNIPMDTSDSDDDNTAVDSQQNTIQIMVNKTQMPEHIYTPLIPDHKRRGSPPQLTYPHVTDISSCTSVADQNPFVRGSSSRNSASSMHSCSSSTEPKQITWTPRGPQPELEDQTPNIAPSVTDDVTIIKEIIGREESVPPPVLPRDFPHPTHPTVNPTCISRGDGCIPTQKIWTEICRDDKSRSRFNIRDVALEESKQELYHHPAYRGSMNTNEIVDLMETQEDGTYVIWNDSSTGNLKISVRHLTSILNFKILRGINDRNMVYFLNSAQNRTSTTSMLELIDFYKTSGIVANFRDPTTNGPIRMSHIKLKKAPS